jgi:hypothetical protein
VDGTKVASAADTSPGSSRDPPPAPWNMLSMSIMRSPTWNCGGAKAKQQTTQYVSLQESQIILMIRTMIL